MSCFVAKSRLVRNNPTGNAIKQLPTDPQSVYIIILPGAISQKPVAHEYGRGVSAPHILVTI